MLDRIWWEAKTASGKMIPPKTPVFFHHEPHTRPPVPRARDAASPAVIPHDRASPIEPSPAVTGSAFLLLPRTPQIPPPVPSSHPDRTAATLGRRRRPRSAGRHHGEATGRCTGGPPAAEQTPRPPAPSLPVGEAPSCCAPRGRVPRPPGARGCDQLPRTTRLARSVPLGPRAPPAGVAAGGATST